MIVDASAILAILLNEPEREAFSDLLTAAPDPSVLSPVNFLEVALRVDRGDMPEAADKLEQILATLNIVLGEVTAPQALLAREAFQKFGKGRHAARLNLGDCFAYAMAKERHEPLLFKGNDFSQTDIKAAIW